jgi:hypothetical protein
VLDAISDLASEKQPVVTGSIREGSNLKLAIGILLRVTIIVVVTGIIAFIKISTKAEPFPTTYFIIWIVGSAVLIGITYWSWRRNRNREE